VLQEWRSTPPHGPLNTGKEYLHSKIIIIDGLHAWSIKVQISLQMFKQVPTLFGK